VKLELASGEAMKKASGEAIINLKRS